MKEFFRGMTVVEGIVAIVASINALALFIFILLAIFNEPQRDLFAAAALYTIVGAYPLGMLSMVYRLTRDKRRDNANV